jgi:hypothetical protein
LVYKSVAFVSKLNRLSKEVSSPPKVWRRRRDVEEDGDGERGVWSLYFREFKVAAVLVVAVVAGVAVAAGVAVVPVVASVVAVAASSLSAFVTRWL